MKKYRILQSKISGKGIFSARPIKKGEIVFIAKGKLTHWVVTDEKASATGPNWLGVGHELWVDPKKDNALTYLNHSCEPNLGIKGKVTFVALRNIAEGEELTFDYSITEDDTLWHLPFICNCGSKNCRKTIRSIQFLPKDAFNRYMPFIPGYFQKVYNKSHKK